MKTSERLRKTALLISPDKSDRQLPSYAFRCRPRELRRLLGADQNRPRLVQIYLSRRRQLDMVLVPHKKRHPDLLLQRLNLQRHRCLRNKTFFRRPRKIQLLRRRHKIFHLF